MAFERSRRGIKIVYFRTVWIVVFLTISLGRLGS